MYSVISNDLTQIVNFPTCIPNCDFCSFATLDFLLFSDVSICFRVVFPPLENTDRVVVSVFIDVPSNSNAVKLKWNV